MNTNTDDPRDNNLARLLQKWKTIEPRDGLEAAVWRRIHTAQTSSPLRDFIGAILPQPAWTTAMAASFAILLGVWAGIARPASPAGGQPTDPLLQSSTLARSYLTMLTGATR